MCWCEMTGGSRLHWRIAWAVECSTSFSIYKNKKMNRVTKFINNHQYSRNIVEKINSVVQLELSSKVTDISKQKLFSEGPEENRNSWRGVIKKMPQPKHTLFKVQKERPKTQKRSHINSFNRGEDKMYGKTVQSSNMAGLCTNNYNIETLKQAWVIN